MTINFWDLLIYILVGSGAVGSLLYFFFKWGSNLFANKVKENWRKESELEISRLESNLERNNQFLSGALENISAIGQLTLEERIRAIKETWNSMLGIKELVSPYTFFLTILKPDEYLEQINSSNFNFSDSGQTRITNFIKEDKTEFNRPFIGDQIWSYYFIYRALNLRTHYLVDKLKKGRSFGYWYQDSGMKQLLSSVFVEKEIEEIKKSEPHSFNRAIEMIEVKILKEINYFISGKKSAIDSFESSEELRKKILQYEPDK